MKKVGPVSFIVLLAATLLLSFSLARAATDPVQAVTEPEKVASEEEPLFDKPAVKARPAGPVVWMIDPGHGGFDNGFPGEKELVLDLAERLAVLNTKAGSRVVLTRSSNLYLPFAERARKVWKEGGTLFLGLHVSEKRFYVHPVGSGEVEVESLRIRGRLVDRLTELFGADKMSDRQLRLEMAVGVAVPGVVLEIPSDMNFRDELTRNQLFEAVGRAFGGNGSEDEKESP